MLRIMAQADWDHLLVVNFRRCASIARRKPMAMGRLAAQYRACFDDFETLKRRPRFEWHFFCDPYRFVCGYLPKLGAYLQDHPDATPKAVAAMLANSRIDTRKEDPKQSAESKMRKAQRDLAAANTLSVMAQREFSDRWSAAKIGRRRDVCRV